MAVLPKKFFSRDSRLVAKELLGCVLVRCYRGKALKVRVVETEAYRGNDPACHASGLTSEHTARLGSKAAFLLEDPGMAYVYLCYGVHWLFNVVTEPKGTVGGVLIRAAEPLEGEAQMQQWRGSPRRPIDLLNGPGKVSQALKIDGRDHGKKLMRGDLYFESAPPPIRILCSPRVGISRGQDLMWRYFDGDSPFVGQVRENLLARRLRSRY